MQQLGGAERGHTLQSAPAMLVVASYHPEMIIDGGSSQRVTPCKSASFHPIGLHAPGWGLEGWEHWKKQSTAQHPGLSCLQLFHAGFGCVWLHPCITEVLVQPAPGTWPTGGQRAARHALHGAAQHAAHAAVQNAQPCSCCPMAPSAVPCSQMPQIPALSHRRTCEAGLAGALRLLPLLAGMAKTPAEKGRKGKPLWDLSIVGFFPCFPK